MIPTDEVIFIIFFRAVGQPPCAPRMNSWPSAESAVLRRPQAMGVTMGVSGDEF